MRFVAMALAFALPTLAHPIHPTSESVTQGQQPLQDSERQLLLVQKLDTQRLLPGRPEPETPGWRAERWEEEVRWWKGEVGGVNEEKEVERLGGAKVGDVSILDGEEGVEVMEEVGDEWEEGEGEEVEWECGEVDGEDGDGVSKW